jgi:hypothetical protein
MLIHLVNGCSQDKTVHWVDAQALAETTFKTGPPMCMKETMVTKNYLIFCSQAERDFLITLCFTSSSFFISLMDHSGIIEMSLIDFSHQTNTIIFLPIIIGLAFLPDQFLGVDTTVTCHDIGVSSNIKFEQAYLLRDVTVAIHESRETLALCRKQRFSVF